VESRGTDREVLVKWLDIIVRNKKDRICLLTDEAMPSGRNVTQKEDEKNVNIKVKNLNIKI
jgi:hypothetical protein